MIRCLEYEAANELPFDILIEIAKWDAVVFAKMYGCCKKLQNELLKYVNFAEMCHTRIEWDGIVIECSPGYYPIALYDRIKPNVFNGVFDVFHDDIRYKMYKGSKCELIIHIKSKRMSIDYTQIHVLKRVGGVMTVISGEIVPFNATKSEFSMAAGLIDKYALKMYGCDIKWELFNKVKCD